MPILPVNRNERAWFGFSTRSRRQATAITVAHKHETFSRNLAPDAVGGSAAANTASTFDEKAAERFAGLALACVGKQYPNKISHVLNSDADVAPPRKLTPAFCGCYDWHSSVHGHWLLVRLLRTFPNAPFAAAGAGGTAKKS